MKFPKCRTTRLYLACYDPHKLAAALAGGARNILISYVFFRNQIEDKFGTISNLLEWCGRGKVDPASCRVMVDSGSYAVTTAGRTVDMNQYIEFLHGQAGHYNQCVNLDLQFKPKVGAANFALMAANGLHKAIHVHHRPEAWKWLDGIRAACGPVLGLSPMPRARYRDKLEYLSMAHSLVPDRPFHWFGTIDIRLMKKFDVASGDSSSFAQTAAYCVIRTPGRKWDFTKKVGKDHYLSATKADRRQFAKYVSSFRRPPPLPDGPIQVSDLWPKTSSRWGGLRNSYLARAALNAAWYVWAEQDINASKNLIPLPDPDEIRSSERYLIDGDPPEGWS